MIGTVYILGLHNDNIFLCNLIRTTDGVPIIPRKDDIIVVDDKVYKVLLVEWYLAQPETEVQVLVRKMSR